jgi:CheY-like chemotaxis protein
MSSLSSVHVPSGSAVPPPLRVLVADDNFDASETLALLLRFDGHEVQVAHDGLEAIDLFERMQPDVAILDIGMPGLSGHEVARRIRAQNTGRPVKLIALTGWGQKADKDRAAESGFDFHFTKPIEPAQLSELIKRP